MTLLTNSAQFDANKADFKFSYDLTPVHARIAPSRKPHETRDVAKKAKFKSVAPARIASAKRAFVTRNMDLDSVAYLKSGAVKPQAGDLVLCKIQSLGQHKRIELVTGRRAFLHIDDEIILSFGARYAADQFEGHVPKDLSDCFMVAAGGIAATFENKNSAVRNPTKIKPIGILCDKNKSVINLKRGVKLTRQARAPKVMPHTIAVVGSGMNAGKTTIASRIVHSLSRENLKVAAIKITGTGSGGDLWQYSDAGASDVLDFTDAGFASTYLISDQQCQYIAQSLIDHAMRARPDVIVLEVADGLLQRETYRILKSPWFTAMIDTLVYAACDGLSAEAGLRLLDDMALPLKAIGGRLTGAPLCQSETQSITQLPILDNQIFADSGKLAHILFGPAV